MKTTAILAALLVSLCRAQVPCADELEGELSAAERAWNVSVAELIDVRAEPLNSCELRDHPMIASTQIYDMVTSESDPDTGRQRVIGRQPFYVIRINSNCDWHVLSLRKAMMHEYGHVLLGLTYHSRDRHSIMYPDLNLDHQDITEADRQAVSAPAAVGDRKAKVVSTDGL